MPIPRQGGLHGIAPLTSRHCSHLNCSISLSRIKQINKTYIKTYFSSVSRGWFNSLLLSAMVLKQIWHVLIKAKIARCWGLKVTTGSELKHNGIKIWFHHWTSFCSFCGSHGILHNSILLTERNYLDERDKEKWTEINWNVLAKYIFIASILFL